MASRAPSSRSPSRSMPRAAPRTTRASGSATTSGQRSPAAAASSRPTGNWSGSQNHNGPNVSTSCCRMAASVSAGPGVPDGAPPAQATDEQECDQGEAAQAVMHGSRTDGQGVVFRSIRRDRWREAGRRWPDDTAQMRPNLPVLSPDLIERILEEAFRVLAETGMEIRGQEMRRRLIEAGLPTTRRRPGAASRATSSRPPSRPRRARSSCTTATATRTPTWARTASTSCPARRASSGSTTGPTRSAWPTRPTSSSTSGWATASSTSPTSPPRSRPTRTSRPRCPTHGGCTWP